ncbi:MAG: hypothetical protein KAZ88_11350, partial [Acidimicrobiia bacterium]|nr:hypothetical protein [Acidimicrobiia bacterium]
MIWSGVCRLRFFELIVMVSFPPRSSGHQTPITPGPLSRGHVRSLLVLRPPVNPDVDIWAT